VATLTFSDDLSTMVSYSCSEYNTIPLQVNLDKDGEHFKVWPD